LSEPEYEIIDAHVHLYRSLDLERQNVRHPGRRDRDRWANPAAVTAFMDREGVSKIVCLPNFPTLQMRQSLQKKMPAGLPDSERADALAAIETELVDKLRRQNEWICRTAAENPRLVPAISMQKVFSPEQMVEELKLRVSQGARIVKMLPGMYHEYPADKAFWPLYEACAELDVAIISDTGTLGQADTGVAYGEPENFAKVLAAFPGLRLVMAHFPSAFWDQRVALAGRFPYVYFDTSGSFGAPDVEVRDGHRAAAVEDAARIIRAVGADRFMFGSDGPRFLFQPQLEQILGLDLTGEEKELILAGNARRIYRIDN
jgi:predicted TIM-barrel fold metal-dependent hydrolase